LLRWLVQEAGRQHVKPEELSACIGLGMDEKTGALAREVEGFPFLRLFNIRAEGSGLDATRAALQRGAQVLDRLLAEGWTIDQAAARLQFTLPLGDDLFPELARLRAVRRALAAMVGDLHPEAALP